MAHQKTPIRSEFESAVINLLDRYGEGADLYYLVSEFVSRGVGRSTCYHWAKKIRECRRKGLPFWLAAPVEPPAPVPALAPPVYQPSAPPPASPCAAVGPSGPSPSAAASPVQAPAPLATVVETLLAYLVVLDDALADDPALRSRIHKRMRALCAGALAA